MAIFIAKKLVIFASLRLIFKDQTIDVVLLINTNEPQSGKHCTLPNPILSSLYEL